LHTLYLLNIKWPLPGKFQIFFIEYGSPAALQTIYIQEVAILNCGWEFSCPDRFAMFFLRPYK